jgi:hypothetical protein
MMRDFCCEAWRAHGEGARQRSWRKHRRRPRRSAVSVCRWSLAARPRAARVIRPARRGRRFPACARFCPAGSALGDQALRNEPSLSFQPPLTRTSMRRTLTNHGRAPPGERGQRGKIPLHRDGRQRVIAVQGRIQREGEVVHLVAHRLVDLSAELATRRQPRRGFPVVAWTRRLSHTRQRRPRSARAPAKGVAHM